VPGAGGRIGAKAVATARPDGYTLLLGGTNINAIIGSLYKDLGFDPIHSFAPIGAICVDSMALAINPRLPTNSFQDFVSYARENPGNRAPRRSLAFRVHHGDLGRTQGPTRDRILPH
jgi:tripartite-type tricarboxylate transporter receptor subunit TctC